MCIVIERDTGELDGGIPNRTVKATTKYTYYFQLTLPPKALFAQQAFQTRICSVVRRGVINIVWHRLLLAGGRRVVAFVFAIHVKERNGGEAPIQQRVVGGTRRARRRTDRP